MTNVILWISAGIYWTLFDVLGWFYIGSWAKEIWRDQQPTNLPRPLEAGINTRNYPYGNPTIKYRIMQGMFAAPGLFLIGHFFGWIIVVACVLSFFMGVWDYLYYIILHVIGARKLPPEKDNLWWLWFVVPVMVVNLGRILRAKFWSYDGDFKKYIPNRTMFTASAAVGIVLSVGVLMW